MMRSPKLAAMGVATLSGLIPVFFDPTMTPTMMMPDRTQIKQPGQHGTAFIPLWVALEDTRECTRAPASVPFNFLSLSF